MTPYVRLTCTGRPDCRAELRVPRADADKYPEDWQCLCCEDEARAEFLLLQATQQREMTREPKQSR